MNQLRPLLSRTNWLRLGLATTLILFLLICFGSTLPLNAASLPHDDGRPTHDKDAISSDVPGLLGFGSQEGPLANDVYATYTYTHSDLILFGYHENTYFEVKDASGVLVWSGSLDDGEHQELITEAGVFRITGTSPYSVLTGDAATNWVLGYYALDDSGRAVSTRLHTYQVDWESYYYYPAHFLVFAYENGTAVTITDSSTGELIWSGSLDKGEHYDNATLDDRYVTVQASLPVSALSFTDQGYYVPASNGLFVGQTFYAYASFAHGNYDFNIQAHSDNTHVTLRDTETGELVWSGTLNAGERHTESSGKYDQFYTVEADKNVTVSHAPVDGNYYHSLYIPDLSGSGIGNQFMHSAIGQGRLVLFSYKDGNEVTLQDSSGDTVWQGTLNQGDFYSHSSAQTTYRISSTDRLSALFDWGDAAGADFAPVYYGASTPLSHGTIAISVYDYYLSSKPIDLSASVHNPGVTSTTYTVVAQLLQNDHIVAESQKPVTVAGHSTSAFIDFQFASRPPGAYTAKVELRVGSEVLDSESHSLRVLTKEQGKAWTGAGRLTDEALGELQQTEDMTLDVLKDGLTRFTIEPTGMPVEEIIKLAARVIAGHFGASQQAIDAITSAVELTMVGVQDVVGSSIEEKATRQAAVMVDKRLAGNDSSIKDREDLFYNQVDPTQIEWDWSDELWLNLRAAQISSIVEAKPYFSVSPMPPYFKVNTFLSQRAEYWVMQQLDWALEVMLIVVAAAVVIAFVLTFFHISVPAIIGGIVAGAAKVGTALKVAGLVKSLVLPVVMFASALAMLSIAYEKVAPAIVSAHDEALDGLMERDRLARSATEPSQFTTTVETEGYSTVVSIAPDGDSSSLPDLVESYLYRADGVLIDIQTYDASEDGTQATAWQETYVLPAGEYSVVTSADIGGSQPATVAPFTVTSPSISLSATLASSAIELGSSIEAFITLVNSGDLDSGALTLIAIAENGATVNSWNIDLSPGETETIRYTFVPQASGSGLLSLHLSDAMQAIERQDVAYSVGSSAAVAVNYDSPNVFPPGENAVVPLEISNVGNRATQKTITLVTHSAELDYSPVFTSTLSLSLDAHSVYQRSGLVLPKAEPGVYRVHLLVDDILYDVFPITVAADGTVYAILTADETNIDQGEQTTLTLRTVDSSFVAIDMAYRVNVAQPDGALQPVVLTRLEQGVYQGTYQPTQNGTHQAIATLDSAIYQTVADETFFVVESPSFLITTVDGQIIEGKESSISVTVRNEAGLPIDAAIVTLSNAKKLVVATTDAQGVATLFIATAEDDDIYQLQARKSGFGSTVSKLATVPALDTTPPIIQLKSVQNGQFTATTPVVVTGHTEIGATLMFDGVLIPVDEEGFFQISVPLAEGPNEFTLIASDNVGNANEVTLTLHLDTVAPALAITSPEDDHTTFGSTVQVRGVTDPGAGVTINGKLMIALPDGSFSYWVPLQVGLNKLEISATDNAGNTTAIVLTVRRSGQLFLPMVRR